MKKINVNADGGSYAVCVGGGLLENIGAMLKETLPKTQKVFVITDETVAPLYLDKTLKNIAEAGFETGFSIIPMGEQSKSGATYLTLLQTLAEKKITRTDALIALGGGVVGDLTGFLAATFLRGIPYVQVPTTLLSMVDSSVGGKTAINLGTSKNLVGAFYQPRLVLCDTQTLQTLPPIAFADGRAEIMKYGMIDSLPLLSQLQSGDLTQMDDIIAQCIAMKRDLVEEDERDTGKRQLLNFGHTIGHAIEQLSHQQISHGQAVALGMVMETRAAVRMGLCPENALSQLIKLLEQFELPTAQTFCAENLLEAALGDKKRHGDMITVVTPRKFGKCELYTMNIEQMFDWIEQGVNV